MRRMLIKWGWVEMGFSAGATENGCMIDMCKLQDPPSDSPPGDPSGEEGGRERPPSSDPKRGFHSGHYSGRGIPFSSKYFLAPGWIGVVTPSNAFSKSIC